MPALDLAPNHRRLLRRLLVQHVPDAEVWAYGSRLRGTAHPGSDLDLVLRTPAQLASPHPRFAQLRAALADSDLPILIDLHDWALLPAAMQREIARAHVVLHAPGVHRNAASRSGNLRFHIA